MITLSTQQLQEALNNKAIAKEGVNEVLRMALNSIMYSEREQFLMQEKNSDNKANGYRPIKVNGYGKQLALAIPRDRLGTFKPLLMAVLKEEEQEKSTIYVTSSIKKVLLQER